MPPSENIGVWFQRSGSFSLLLCVFAEIYFLKNLTLSSKIVDNNINIDKKNFQIWFTVMKSYTENLVHLLTVISTMIWGYGDIIHNYSLS